MKTKQLLALSLLAASAQAFGQSDAEANQYVTKANLPTVFNRTFRSVINGSKDLSSVGDYLGVNITNPSATVNVFKELANKNDNIWGFMSCNFSGGITDNVVGVFTNDKFNTGFSGKVNFSVIVGKVPGFRPALWYTEEYKSELDTKRADVNNYFDGLKAGYNDDIARFQQLNSMSERSANDMIEIKELRRKLQRSAADADKMVETMRADSLRKIETEAKYSSVRVSWFDFYVSANQQRNYLFDNTKTVSDMLQKNDFTAKKLGISFNYYFESDFWLSTKHRWLPLLNGMLKLDYELGYGNNISDLTGTETSRTNSYDSVNSKIVQTTKVNAYNKSEYAETYFHFFRVQLYQKLTKDKSIALHPYYEIKYTFADFKDVFNTTGEVRNAGVGFIITMKNKEDKPSKISIEPYLTFRDLMDNQKAGNSWSQRNEIGIRTGIPLQHIFQK
jgi:hypothetical protein